MWQHQRIAVDWCLRRQASLLWYGMGTGKSRILCEILNALVGQNGSLRCLIGCPKAVIDAWSEVQLPRWSPGIRVVALTQSSAKAKAAAVVAAAADTRPLIVVGNYESLWRLKEIEAIRWSVLAWDEVHRLKSASGAASKWAAKMVKLNPSSMRVGLSGTLISHSPLDAWGTWRAVGLESVWGSTWTTFKANNFVPMHGVPGAVKGLRNDRVAWFQERVSQTVLSAKSEDVLDLPEIMHEQITFSLAGDEVRVYRELESEFAASIHGGIVTPANAMVSVLRMLQACGGFVRLDDSAHSTQINSGTASKAARLAEWLSDLDRHEPLVVFCRFSDDIAAAKREIAATGRSVSELSGRMNQLAEWQAGKTDALVTQIQSGGIGIDLTRASYGVFYSLGHSLAEYLQAVARLHRPGQTRTTRLYSLIARLPGNRQTVEGRVHSALAERKDVIDELLDGYRRGDAGKADADGACEHSH